MICHFNLDTFELLEKLQFERERADGSTEPSADSMFKCNHLAGATDGGIRSSGRSNPDVSGISQNKKQGVLQSGSQKIVHKPRNPCRVKTAQKEFRGSDFALFICVSCYCSFILQQALLVLCSKNQFLLLNESNLLRYTVNHFDKVFLTKHFNQIGNLLSLLLLVMIKYCCFHPLAIN